LIPLLLVPLLVSILLLIAAVFIITEFPQIVLVLPQLAFPPS